LDAAAGIEEKRMSHKDNHDDKGKPFYLNIEGELIPWDDETITTEQLIELGGWDPSLRVQEIDLMTNEARTLKPGEVVLLKPGMGFAKKFEWKRG